MTTNLRIKAARAAYEAATQQHRDACLTTSSARRAVEEAEAQQRLAAEAVKRTGLALDNTTNPPTCEMGSGDRWKRVVITRRAGEGLWVRDYGQPDGLSTRFVLLSGGVWCRHGDSYKTDPVCLRGVP